MSAKAVPMLAWRKETLWKEVEVSLTDPQQ